MHTTKFIGIGAGIAAAAALAAPMLTGSAAAGGGESFTVYAVHPNETFVDAGRHGFSAGDTDVHSDQLTSGGKTIGWDTGSCLVTAVTPNRADQICQFVLNLPGGQIVADGAVQDGPKGPGTFALGITGGTSHYQTARGEITVTATDGPAVPIAVHVIR
jgi:hypothetical protein